MTQDEAVGAEYTRLREAAILVLDALPDAEDRPTQVDGALRSLRAVLSGDVSMQSDTGAGTLDPFEQMLTVRRYTGRRAEPVSLPQQAADLRRQLDGDRALDERLPGEPSRNVVVTELRAMIVASLLEELAARLSPGVAFGPGRNGEELAQLAVDLAKELLDQTFLGQ
ncbi:hypothetical protein [Actinomadura sp. 7K507]|uniref:hypothetical protein n=1 Tax=Actinomadura sp. 7K507 TaxID=2530365 RepID=UPI001048E63B|nr:hypothetical protein [Actinomadura sp. 7K507]TDC73670.1 hypothetical protein E1285_44425 [Actinomadura sp. 7K507]